ncbi:MAG TPA: DUF3127 domain-containing protein [Kofleriaceae bacterium]|jgi:hypothetical protein
MGMETNGKLVVINETKQVSERFSKREFVVELADNPKYPQRVLFQLTGDRCSQLDGLKVGDDVRLEFSLRGREWRSPQGETKYFNSLDVWKIESASESRGARGGGNSRYANTDDDRGGRGGGGGAPRRGGGGTGDPRDREQVPPRSDEDYGFGTGATTGGGGGGGDDDLPF